MCGELAGLIAGQPRSAVAPQFGSRASKPKENLRLSEATAKWPRRSQARQFCAARCLPLPSPSSRGNCWFGEPESALPLAQSCEDKNVVKNLPTIDVDFMAFCPANLQGGITRQHNQHELFTSYM